MARYIIKRKTYSILGNTVGGVTSAVGGAMNSTVGRLGGGLLGWRAGRTIGNMLSAAGVPFGGLIGRIGGFIAGKSIMSGLGKGLKNTGQDMMYR
jgi:hypothetical protein